MKKLALILLSTLLATSAIANQVENNEHVGEKQKRLHEKHEKVSPYYITLKPMVTNGGTIDEGSEVLTGSNAYGLGLDAGYYIFSQLAIEFSTTYSLNTVSKLESAETIDASATYYSVAVNIVYKQPIFHEFAIFGKLGYEFEEEIVDTFDIKENSTGIDYAFGLSYEISHHIGVLAEYESSTIDSLRGDAYFIGAEYRF